MRRVLLRLLLRLLLPLAAAAAALPLLPLDDGISRRGLSPSPSLGLPEFFAPAPCAVELAKTRMDLAMLRIARFCLEREWCKTSNFTHQPTSLQPNARAVANVETALVFDAELRQAALGLPDDHSKNVCNSLSTRQPSRKGSPLSVREACYFRQLIQTALRANYSTASWRRLTLHQEARKASHFFGHPTLLARTWDVRADSPSLEKISTDADRCAAAPRVAREEFYAASHLQHSPQCPAVAVQTRELLRVLDGVISQAHTAQHQCSRASQVDFAGPQLTLPGSPSGPLSSLLSRFPSECPIPEKDQRFLTFLRLLGQGKEAEVWSVCVWDPRNPAVSHTTAFKAFRRAFKGNAFMLNPGERFSKDSRKQRAAPPDDVTWAKLQKSLFDAIEFSALLPPSVAVLATSIYDIGSTGLPQLSVDRHLAVNRYTVYLGLGAAFPTAASDLQAFVNGQAEELDAEEIRAIARSLLEAVEACDRVGFAWMDLKPPNILMIDGQAKIGDIGFMRPINELAKYPGIGTAGYRPFESYAPTSEKLFRVTQTRAMFALGVSLYALMFGTLPWNERQIKGLARRATSLEEWKLEIEDVADDELSRELREVLEGLLHPNPVRRWSLEKALMHPYFSATRATK